MCDLIIWNILTAAEVGGGGEPCREDFTSSLRFDVLLIVNHVKHREAFFEVIVQSRAEGARLPAADFFFCLFEILFRLPLTFHVPGTLKLGSNICLAQMPY